MGGGGSKVVKADPSPDLLVVLVPAQNSMMPVLRWEFMRQEAVVKVPSCH